MTETERSRLSAVLIAHFPRATSAELDELVRATGNYPMPVIIEAVTAERGARGELFPQLDVRAIARRCAGAFPMLAWSTARTVEDAHARLGQIRQKREEELAEACAVGAGVPDRFAEAMPWQVHRVPAALRRRYLAAFAQLDAAVGRGETIALSGPAGSGRTHAACALINALCEAGRAAIYTTPADYVDEIRRRWSAGRPTAAYQRRHRRAGLLVLDDMSIGDGTVTASSLVAQLVRARDDRKRSTVLIVTPAEKRKVAYISPEILPRVTTTIDFTWPSLRGRLEA